MKARIQRVPAEDCSIARRPMAGRMLVVLMLWLIIQIADRSPERMTTPTPSPLWEDG